MFESIALSVVAVGAGACLTFLVAILLPEPVAAKAGRGGLYAGLGDEVEGFEHSSHARARRMRALMTRRGDRRPTRLLPEGAPSAINRHRARSACPERAH